VRIISESDQERALRRGLGFGKGLSSLLDALEKPNQSEHFKFLRSEFLQQIPNYSNALLPALKEKSLEQLIVRFNDNDWRDWPRSHLAEEGKPSSARAYLDLIFARNRELGLFLETSALLLHRLYLTTQRGEVFDIQRGFDEIVKDASALLVAHQPSTLPAKFLLSYSVPRDLSFLPTFERERSRLVAEFVSQRGLGDLERSIRLLASIDGRYATPEAAARMTEALLTVSVDGSVRLRAQVVHDLLDDRALNNFFIGSGEVKRAAAQLAAVSAVDSLESRDLLRAKQLVSLSLTLYPGLPSQQLVINFFKDYRLGFLKEELASTVVETPATQGSVSYLGATILAVIALVITVGLVAFSRGQRRARILPGAVSPTLVRSPVREELAKELDPGEDRKVVNFVRQ
jgi:hypothetical protein